jgi:hypothetical protein
MKILNSPAKPSRTLVSYLYKEDPNDKINLEFFLRHGTTCSEDVDYVFLINDYRCTASIPDSKNIRIVKKDNSFDLEAYEVGLSQVDPKGYGSFIFLNSSCIGPFIPNYVDTPWYSIIAEQFKGRVKLVAPILEIPPDNLGAVCLDKHKHINSSDRCVPFLHTYMFATDHEALPILRESVFSKKITSREELIVKYERLVTSAVLNDGYTIKSFMRRYRSIDFSNKQYWDSEKWTNSRQPTCPEVAGNYDGIDVAPFEIMFVKNIRRRHAFRRNSGISETLQLYLEKYMQWD